MWSQNVKGSYMDHSKHSLEVSFPYYNKDWIISNIYDPNTIVSRKDVWVSVSTHIKANSKTH